MALLMGGAGSAFAENKEETVINENFDNGETLFTGIERMTVGNDNNVKFTTTDRSTRLYSNATYDFNTDGAVAVKIQYSYWIANKNYNDVAFIIRDKGIVAGHERYKMGLNGAFISIGRSLQSRKNYFSINHGKTISASDENLGLWCSAEVYIDLVNKTIDYKVSKLDGGATIKEEKGIPFLDTNATSVSQIDFFACVDKETDYLDNLVITKYTSDSPLYNYTVNAVCNGKTIKTLERGIALSTNNKMVFYPICLNVGNTWYVTAEKQYGIVIDSNIEKNIEYTANKNIVAFAEAESSTNAPSDNINYSSGKSGYVAPQNHTNRGIFMGTLAPGKYKMVVSVLGNAKRGVTLRNQNSDDSKTNIIAKTDEKSTGLQTVDFVLTESLPLIVNGKNGDGKYYNKSNQSADFDYIYIEKTAEPLTLNTATDYTYSTFCSDYDLDFSSVNDVEVYKVAILGDKVVTTKIEDGKVKAGTGIIIKNVNHVASVTVPVTSNVADLTGNDLKAATTDVPSDGAKYFALTKLSDGKVGFALVAKDVVIPAGKAYLEVANGTAGPAAKFFGLDGEATGINSVKTAKADGAYYTLEGVKTTKPVKGLYIHNGKKIVVK